jgi:hypothetical protein
MVDGVAIYRAIISAAWRFSQSKQAIDPQRGRHGCEIGASLATPTPDKWRVPPSAGRRAYGPVQECMNILRTSRFLEAYWALGDGVSVVLAAITTGRQP